MQNAILLLSLVLVLLAARPLAAEESASRVLPGVSMDKKLLLFGWHDLQSDRVLDHREAIEGSPFDAITIKVRPEAGGGKILLTEQWAAVSEEEKQAELRHFEAIGDAGLSPERFIVMYAASDVDWLAEGAFDPVVEQVEFVMRLAEAAGCRGIIWDPESYGGLNPFKYDKQPGADGSNFAAYAERVREAGARYMEAMQRADPDVVILTLRAWSDFWDYSPFTDGPLPRDEADFPAFLQEAWWGLHASFMEGMLAAVEGEAVLSDGNEDAYYYTDEGDFDAFRRVLQTDLVRMVEPALRGKLIEQVRVYHAVSLDYTQGIWDLPDFSFPIYLKRQGTELSEQERLRWLGQNLYHALRGSDEYVWLYAEDQNFWTGEGVPAGVVETIRETKRLVADGEPLGGSVTAKLAAIREELRSEHGEAR